MTVAVQVAGKASIYIATATAPTVLSLLGYSRDRVDASHEPFFLDVPGDENGGEPGPPVEIQFLGEIARVRLELSKWDFTQVQAVKARVVGGTAGTPAPAGSLMFAGNLYMRLLINPANQDPINFPQAIARGVIEQNRGTKWSQFVCEFECHKSLGSGILYNNTTS